jgi:hypothetical protein
VNIIEVLQSALETFPKINDLHIDYNENAPDSFGLYPTGDRLITQDIIGNQKRNHNFILYADFLSFNDYLRLQNSSTLLELHYWLEHYADGQEVTAIIGENEYIGELTKITCSNGMLFSIPDGNMNTAVRYTLQIAVEYTISTNILIESEE